MIVLFLSSLFLLLCSLTRPRKGVADEELAKREAERKAEELKQRRLRETDADHGVTADSGADQSLRRRRSVSSASDSSVPTYRSTASPPPRWSRSPSPPPRERDLSSGPSGSRSAHYRRHRSPSGDSYDNEPPASRLSEANRQSESPAPRRRRRSSSRGSLSPPPRRERAYRERSPDYGRHDRSSRYGRDRRFSPAPGGSFRPRSPSRSRSRSRSLSKPPVRRDRRDYSPERHPPRRRAEDASRERPQRTPQREPERERSLSPFSKRLAMTRAMNMGRGR